VKINQPFVPPVNHLTKNPNVQAVAAAAAAIERQNLREDARKKKVSRTSSNPSTPAPSFGSSIARELSHRLASEAHDHEEKSEEKSDSDSESESDSNSEK
jgi:hypothetical protein